MLLHYCCYSKFKYGKRKYGCQLIQGLGVITHCQFVFNPVILFSLLDSPLYRQTKDRKLHCTYSLVNQVLVAFFRGDPAPDEKAVSRCKLFSSGGSKNDWLLQKHWWFQMLCQIPKLARLSLRQSTFLSLFPVLQRATFRILARSPMTPLLRICHVQAHAPKRINLISGLKCKRFMLQAGGSHSPTKKEKKQENKLCETDYSDDTSRIRF